MILDAQLKVSAAQALTSTAASTDYIDLGVGRNVFDGEPMAFLVHVNVAADAGNGDETYSFAIQCDDNTSFSSPTSLVSHSIARASLSANSLHILPIPIGVDVERYLRLNYTLGGTTPSITLSAYLVPLSHIQKYRVYADGFTIS